MAKDTQRQLDEATRQLATLLHAGLTLGQALARQPAVFDTVYCSLVAAGELGGLVESMLERIASHRERASRLRGKVRSALVYPAAVLLVAGLSIGVILAWVVPTFQAMFEQAGSTLPLPTQIVVAASDALVHHGVWLGLAAVIAVPTFIWRWRVSPGLQRGVESLLLRLPLLGRVLSEAAAARWCRTLGMLLGAGVPLTDALATVGRVAGQHRLATATRRIRSDTAMGERLAPGLARSGCFPELALQMAHIGEESGTLDDLLIKAAEGLEQSVETTVAQMTTLLEPAIMLVLGLVMGGVIIALYLPVFQLGSAVT